MTENDLRPRPIEQRLRRTFAVRAEDMAPGDGAAGHGGSQLEPAPPAGGGFEPHRNHAPARVMLVAAIVVIVGVALATIGVVVASDDGDGTGDRASDRGGEQDAPVLALMTGSRDLVAALEDERNLATITLIGQADGVSLPVQNTEEATGLTDAAIAAFESVVAADPQRPAYQAALDRLDGLGTLRSDVDADVGPRSLENLGSATTVFDRYSEMVGGLLDALGEATRTIDDPDLRVGAQVYLLGLHQREVTAQLVWKAMLYAIEPGPATVADLSSLDSQLRQGQEDLLARATGTPYEAAATTALDEVATSGLLDVVATGLEGTGTMDLPALLAAASTPADRGWPAFLDHVEQLLTATG